VEVESVFLMSSIASTLVMVSGSVSTVGVVVNFCGGGGGVAFFMPNVCSRVVTSGGVVVFFMPGGVVASMVNFYACVVVASIWVCVAILQIKIWCSGGK
jgi:hypothetical protein